MSPPDDDSPIRLEYARRHLRFGWWSLFFFATLGFFLESLHAFKVRMYLDVSSDTRRLMWTLAHAHGTVLSLVNVIYGLFLRVAPEAAKVNVRLTSWCLICATILLPGGFFLGGIAFYSGDPGLGIVVVPIGAVLLLIAVFVLGRATTTGPDGSAVSPPRRSKESVRKSR